MMPFKFPLPGEKALVMGIINMSPDSFYGESCCKTVEQALSAAERMLEEGADIIDIGAESSRPGPFSPAPSSPAPAAISASSRAQFWWTPTPRACRPAWAGR